MKRHELMAKLEEIQLNNYNKFKGGNEADLQTREDIADLIEDEMANVIKFAIENMFNGELAGLNPIEIVKKYSLKRK